MYKQPPLWIINSTFALFFIAMLIFVVSTRYKLPGRTTLQANYIPNESSKDVSKIDISLIYRNDLFNTYKEPTQAEIPAQEKKLILPPPPPLRPAIPVERRPVQFLEPLPITLKGVMYSTDERYNRVVIEENKTHAEKLYKVGDIIEDAEIVRIYYNKIMLIRSNGQQETLFISPVDAQKDPIYGQDIMWSEIIKQVTAHEFMIDKDKFVSSVKNLAEFIDMLDITTAFKKGKSIGCRVGALKPQSVGFALGLAPNDIVVSVDGIIPTSTNERVEIFTKVKNLNYEDNLVVVVMRNGQELTFNYTIMPYTQAEEAAQPHENSLPTELIHMHEMSNKLVSQAQITPNPMVKKTHQNNMTAMTNTSTSSSLMQHVPT